MLGQGQGKLLHFGSPNRNPLMGKGCQCLGELHLEMKQYFKAYRMEDEGEKVNTGVTYLTDDAILCGIDATRISRRDTTPLRHGRT